MNDGKFRVLGRNSPRSVRGKRMTARLTFSLFDRLEYVGPGGGEQVPGGGEYQV